MFSYRSKIDLTLKKGMDQSHFEYNVSHWSLSINLTILGGTFD